MKVHVLALFVKVHGAVTKGFGFFFLSVVVVREAVRCSDLDAVQRHVQGLYVNVLGDAEW